MKALRQKYPDVFADDNELYPDYDSYITFADALVSDELAEKFIEQLKQAYTRKYHHSVFTMGKTADAAEADFRRKRETLQDQGKLPDPEALAAYREAKLRRIASRARGGLGQSLRDLLGKVRLPGDWEEKRVMLAANTQEELAIMLGDK